jgi:hypothetical protein
MVRLILALLSLFISLETWAAEKGGEDKKEHGGAKAVDNELQLTDLVVPVLLREEVQAYYSLSMTISPKDESQKAVLAKFGPRIKDAIIRDLYLILPLIWNKDEQPNIEKLKVRLESVAKKATPDNTIGAVIINAFQLNDAKKQGLDVDKSKAE